MRVPNGRLRLWWYGLLTTATAVVIGLGILNPLWSWLAVPGLFPEPVAPPITAPIDGLYYIRNAVNGYDWSGRDPLSLWFHPLLSTVLAVLPKWLPPNIWFWLIGISSGLVALVLVFELTAAVAEQSNVSSKMLILCLIAPGGLGLATGNAEIPTLCFTLAVTLSVVKWQKWWVTALAAAGAISTKPNALYLVAMLLVYFAVGLANGNRETWRQALIGLASLIGTWLAWIVIVDLLTGYAGAYWEARMAAGRYLGLTNHGAFFDQMATAFADPHNLRDHVRYTVALVIPVANLILIGLAPISDEHRYAFAAGNLAMLAVTLWLGNPNKIIVYTTTLPGYFPVHLMCIARPPNASGAQCALRRRIFIIIYGIYCLSMILVFVVGTPLRWYH